MAVLLKGDVPMILPRRNFPVMHVKEVTADRERW